MEFFRIRRDIPFMRHALVFNIISLLTFLAAVFFLATRGLHFSIEFTGGTVIEAAYAQTADIGKVRTAVERLGVGEVQVQNFGSSRDVLIRVPVREGVKQSEVVTRVFAELCRAEGGTIGAQAGAQAESTPRQVCFGRCRRARAPAAKRVRRPASRARAGRRRRQGARLRRRRHHDVPGVSLRMEVLDRGDHREPARRRHHPRLLRLLPVGVLAVGAGRRCWRCWAIRSTSRSSSSTGSASRSGAIASSIPTRSSTTPSPARSAAPSSRTARPR